MKISIEKYNPNWINTFNDIEKILSKQLGALHPTIEHIGSTAVAGLSAKPIIDILTGISEHHRLNDVIEPLISIGCVYYEKYNSEMPYRRFFVLLKTKPDNFLVPKIYRENDIVPYELHHYKSAHIHVVEYNTIHWIRHIAFRDYLRNFPKIRNRYQALKMQLSAEDWLDANKYNDAKNNFIKETEQNALKWHEMYNSC